MNARGGMARGRTRGAVARGARGDSSRGRGAARGGARGRGSRGATRGRGGSRQRNIVLSTIPWQTADVTNTAPMPLTFTETPGPQIELPSTPQPVEFLTTFLDEDVLGHVMDETNR